jgi:hypothetical protein
MAVNVFPKLRETSKRPFKPPPWEVNTIQTFEPKAAREMFSPLVLAAGKVLVVVQSSSVTGDETSSYDVQPAIRHR